MARIAITGANGFLGFHVRAALQEGGHNVLPVAVGDRFDADLAKEALATADELIHLAGVNRGAPEEVERGNQLFSEQISSVLQSLDGGPRRVVFANSIQSTMDNPYGRGKQSAAERLASTATTAGRDFDNVMLPNIFGEFGRPHYNSVVATFASLVAQGESPTVLEDRVLPLLHAQDAADVLTGRTPVDGMTDLIHHESVSGIKTLLDEFADVYRSSEIPNISTVFRRNMFNTYRSCLYPSGSRHDIRRHADERGAFFEICRSNGGTGQTSFSTTEPGVTRGDHFHRRKVERFTVLSGEAEISLRKLGSDEVHKFRISGTEPASVDMPTLCTHNIKNIGTELLYTSFWTNDLYDPGSPDTIMEAVK